MSTENLELDIGESTVSDALEVGPARSALNFPLIVLMVLFVSVIFVAIKTVVHRHESRTAYLQLQKLEKERDKLVAQWSRLKLEQATTLNRVRVERYARWDLNMKMPKASEMMVIHESILERNISKSKNDVATVTELDDAAVASSDVILEN